MRDLGMYRDLETGKARTPTADEVVDRTLTQFSDRQLLRALLISGAIELDLVAGVPHLTLVNRDAFAKAAGEIGDKLLTRKPIPA